MVNQYKIYSQAQFRITEGDLNTSAIEVSGSLRIDWLKYQKKKGLMDCLNFNGNDVRCNVPNPALIDLAGDTTS